jgi:hypothetical protein
MYAHEQTETDLPHNGCEGIGTKSKKMSYLVSLIRLYELETFGRDWDPDKAQQPRSPHFLKQKLRTQDAN